MKINLSAPLLLMTLTTNSAWFPTIRFIVVFISYVPQQQCAAKLAAIVPLVLGSFEKRS